MSVAFFSEEWAQEARVAVNAGPSPEVRAKKLDKFWSWIEKAKEGLTCELGLAIRDLPNGHQLRAECLLLQLEDGVCTASRLTSRAEAEASATFILAGDLAAWEEIMGGYDMGKTIMYRKLLLEKGSVLEFFKSIYYWTESLACIQRIPTRF